jgi:flagellar basal-body rod protein FlgB
MINQLFNQTPFLILEAALDATSARSHVIANNIANADTPNYKAQRLKFEDILTQEFNQGESSMLPLRRTNALHLPASGIEVLRNNGQVGVIYTDDSTTYRLDGNNVDIDQEMAEQSKNAIQYSTLTELISRRFASLRTIISEGSR